MIELLVEPGKESIDGPDAPPFWLSLDNGHQVIYKGMSVQDLIDLEGLCAKLRLDREAGDAPKQRGMVHLTVPDNKWVPSPEDLKTLVDAFQNAEIDPLGKFVSNRSPIQLRTWTAANGIDYDQMLADLAKDLATMPELPKRKKLTMQEFMAANGIDYEQVLADLTKDMETRLSAKKHVQD
jgi:hypothetical protein